jgi:hypothetical protein
MIMTSAEHTFIFTMILCGTECRRWRLGKVCTHMHAHTQTHVYNNWSNRDCNINYSSGSNGLCKMQVRTADLANSLVKDALHGWIWWVQQIVYLFMHTWDVCHVKGFVGKRSQFTYLFYVRVWDKVLIRNKWAPKKETVLGCENCYYFEEYTW